MHIVVLTTTIGHFTSVQASLNVSPSGKRDVVFSYSAVCPQRPGSKELHVRNLCMWVATMYASCIGVYTRCCHMVVCMCVTGCGGGFL